LIIEDDDAIRQGVVDALEFAGYTALEASDGVQGARSAVACEIDLILLDLMLPGMDGFEVLAEVRTTHPGLPIIMLTARGSDDDRVRGLQEGADDYVVKPFSARELLARVDAVLRRAPDLSAVSGTLMIGHRTIDLDRREVRFLDGKRQELSVKETALLRFLAEHKDKAVSRDAILSGVWGLDPRGLQTRTVDMHVARLRERLKDTTASVIVTVRSQGYMLTFDVKDDA